MTPLLMDSNIKADKRKGTNMISASNISLRVGKKALFEDVNIKFTEGNCYGLIGANGAGKSTFLRILSGQLEPTSGDVIITPGQRLSFLQQDHFKYDGYTAVSYTHLAGGMGTSIQIFMVTLVFSLPLGLVVAFGRMSKNKYLQAIVKVYISIMRGTPLMLQLMVVYFGPYYLFCLLYTSRCV